MSLGATTASDVELGSSAEILSRRRASASVEEIRNLYSALQELVPVPSRAAATPKINQPETPHNGVDEQAVKPNVLEVPKENCLQVQQPRKRLLPTPPGSPRVSNKFGQAPGTDAPVNGAKDQSHGRQSPGLARKSLEGDVKVSRKGSNSANLISLLRRRSTGNCLTPDTPDKKKSQVINVDEKSRKMKLSPFVKRKLLSPFTRRRGSTPNLVIVNTEEQPSSPLKSTSPKAATKSPTVSRRGSLADAINMLAKTDNIEVLLRDERKRSVQGNSLREGGDASRDGSKMNLGMLEGQMELLLKSLDELQDVAGASCHGAQPTDSEIIQRLEERRGSLGTEMRELLDALKELTDTNSRCPNSPASSVGEPSSRRSSYHESVSPTTQKESLDSLEAYFNQKLRNATKSKMPPNASEMPPNVFDMPPNVFDMPPNVSECHVSDDREHLDQTDGAKAERANIETPPLTITIEAEERVEVLRPSKSSEDLEPGSCKAEAQLDRKQWKKEQREFALQVNGKLEEWLTRATALSTKGKTTSEETGQQLLKETGGKSSKRKILSKRSFKRQREKNKEEYRTRRSQSLHDIFAEEDPENDHEGQQQEEMVKQVADKIPAGLVASVARSKSMQDVTTNNKKKRQYKRYASHECSNSKACVEIGSAPRASEGDVTPTLQNHGLGSPVHSSKGARKQRMLPKDPALMRRGADEQPASTQTQSSRDGSLGHAQRKRPSRLPTDLPLFYNPGAASAVPNDSSSQQGLEELSYKEMCGSTPDIKKSLFPQATKRYSGNFDLLYAGGKQELFYTNKEPGSASGTSCRSATSHASHFTIDVNNGHLQNSRFDSRTMPFFCKENSRESQTLQRVTSHDSLLDYSDDYRDGTRSESDDSGCPGNEFTANEIAVQTEPSSQFNERDRVQENIERPESSRTLRRLRSNSRRSPEVSDLGVTV